MTITVITGTPGSGKTLLAIEKHLRGLVGTSVEETNEAGELVKHPRTIYTNINGLLLDHELIEAGPAWVSSVRDQQVVWSQGPGTALGLHNWHEWAPPGAVICFDEFQRAWPPRANGSHVPPDISALDTHRHKGVDFILITQNVMNADRHIHGLTNVHYHVRRMGNLGAALVYEWDHCSRTLMYSKAFTKKPWRYDRSVFKLYTSARVHTKQKRPLPALIWFVLVGAVGVAIAAPTLKARISDRIGGKSPAVVSAPPMLPKAAPLPVAARPAAGASGAVLVPPGPPPVLRAGCTAYRSICRCDDGHGAGFIGTVDACT